MARQLESQLGLPSSSLDSPAEAFTSPISQAIEDNRLPAKSIERVASGLSPIHSRLPLPPPKKNIQTYRLDADPIARATSLDAMENDNKADIEPVAESIVNDDQPQKPLHKPTRIGGHTYSAALTKDERLILSHYRALSKTAKKIAIKLMAAMRD